MFCSFMLDSYIGVCGSGTFPGSCWIYLSYLGVGKDSFRLPQFKVSLMVLSWVFGSLVDMLGVTLLCIL